MAEFAPSGSLSALAVLAEPLRNELYELVRRGPGPVSREQAAESLGIAKHLASFHLDRLHAAGLLAVEYRRPAGKGGPGAGRPTKYYRIASGDLEVSVPPRRYAFAGSVLARAIGRSSREGLPIREALRMAAAEAGQQLAGDALRTAPIAPEDDRFARMASVLDAFGYGSRVEGGVLSLGNCPFRALADEDTELVCGMNLDLLTGLVEGLGEDGSRVRLDPAAGRCCVTFALPAV